MHAMFGRLLRGFAPDVHPEGLLWHLLVGTSKLVVRTDWFGLVGTSNPVVRTDWLGLVGTPA